MTSKTPPGLTGSPIDRADHIRTSEEAVASAMRDMRARLLRLDDLDPHVDEIGALGWGSIAECPDDSDLIFLGLAEDVPCFAALDEEPRSAGQNAYSSWRYLDILEPGEASTYAAARGLIEWHRRHLFCSQCGSRSRIAKAGWARQCDNCGAEHFPRVDPVVIMLAEYGDKVLVGRQPRFPPDRYSALAGFVEPGESLEEAVARELFEEAGVRATSMRYLASQPWPFPGSLMMACIAPVENDALKLDAKEIEDAIWVTRPEVDAALKGEPGAPFVAPPHFAIAHSLLRYWVEGH